MTWFKYAVTWTKLLHRFNVFINGSNLNIATYSEPWFLVYCKLVKEWLTSQTLFTYIPLEVAHIETHPR